MQMNINLQFAKKLELPPVSQIGIVVKDMDKTIEYYEKVLRNTFIWETG